MAAMTNHNPTPPAAGSLMDRVRRAIEDQGLSPSAAARQIGVGAATLRNHLAGEHVRSDSARKYENWLAGRQAAANVFVLPTRAEEAVVDAVLPPPPAPARPRLVVDIFSGCGGLSLGFDLHDGGRQFRTVLAIDNQSAPIAVLNRNARLMGHGDRDVGRQMDLTEFLTETEVLAFYVDHAARALGDDALAADLAALSDGAFPVFLDRVAAADRALLEALDDIRAGEAWRRAAAALDRQALNQTSVIGFHEKLKLPRTSSRSATLPLVLWADADRTPAAGARVRPSADDVATARAEWDHEVAGLSDRRTASGRGQLTASARRMTAFVAFLDTPAMAAVREAWARWRAERLTLRAGLFEDARFSEALRRLYAERCPVSVLVGGPPCQGFSRIGRGKIRSLREAQVHVHGCAEAGDARNLLFQQYVLVLGALRPDAFLFENVQHFQSTVKADGVEFQATEVLAEAIAAMSEGEATYAVSSRVLDASRHGVPQTRQRYFMAGVRADRPQAEADAAACLDLRRLPEARLGQALAGLGSPGVVGGGASGDAMAAPRPAETAGADPFTAWIRQPRPGAAAPPATVDAHAARAPRADDAAFFTLMGPGRRWMDYRADEAETVDALAGVLDALLALPDAALDAAARAAWKAGQELPDREALAELRSRVDGSLPLRLLLEQAGEKLGAPHHLLTQSYLAKRDGHHGDWVARLDATRPAKTMVSHMGKDTYAYVHPYEPRTISVREAARVQSFPDWFAFEGAALTDAFKMVGNAVPPMLSHGVAERLARILSAREAIADASDGRRRLG